MALINPDIKKIYKSVLDFQRKNSISSKCVMNSIFYFDMLDQFFPGEFEVVCGIIVITKAYINLKYGKTNVSITKDDHAMIGHVWIQKKGHVGIIECSSEFVDLPRKCKTYFNFQEFVKVYGHHENTTDMLSKVCALNVQVCKLMRQPNAVNQYYKNLRDFVKEKNS